METQTLIVVTVGVSTAVVVACAYMMFTRYIRKRRGLSAPKQLQG